MLKSGYWIFEFLPISRIVLDAPAKYARAYLYSESDSGDVTYFIFYHLRIIERAVREMIAYFQRQQDCMQRVSEFVARHDLNHRQLAAANYAIQHPNSAQSFKEHANVHNIVLATSRNDLLGLERLGILERRKYGKTIAFVASAVMRNQLKVGAFCTVHRKRPPNAIAITKASSEITAADKDERQLELPL